MARVAADPMKVAMITATELLKLAVVLSPFLKGQVGTIGGGGGVDSMEFRYSTSRMNIRWL